MIISRGLGDLLAKNVEKFERCVKTKYGGEAGDRAFTGCVWELGVAPTDPGPFLLGTSLEPLFGTFQRGNPGVPFQWIESAYKNVNVDEEKFGELASMVTWHAKAGAAGRHLSDVIADIHAFTNLMGRISSR
jgi:hypothetical protein